MSCRNLPPSRSAVLVLVLGCLLTGLAACGKKGDPLPPLRVIPQKTTDLKIRQQGQQILLEMHYPNVTAAGLALGEIDAVELYELVRPTVEGQPPAPILDPEFDSAATVLLTLRGTELDAAVTGDRIQIRLPLEAELPETPSAHYFAVRTLKGEETSVTSNRAVLIPMPPPPPPENLAVTARADGIELSWQTDDERAVGFDVFRRQASDRGYGEALERVAKDQRSFVDATARYGERYIYTVRTVAGTEPLIHSAEAGEREIDYADRFAPPLPAGFVALGERGRVRLRWDASDASDVAGYRLFRREPGRDFHTLTDEPVTELEYLDRGLSSGLSFDYRIQVVDQVGNESPLSEPVTTTVR